MADQYSYTWVNVNNSYLWYDFSNLGRNWFSAVSAPRSHFFVTIRLPLLSDLIAIHAVNGF